MRRTIKAGIEEYSAMEDRLKNKLSNIENGSSHPSAPSEHLDDDAPTAPAEDQEPSAPALIQTFHSPECVVCLERKVSKQASPWFFSILSSKVICQKDNHIGTQLYDLAILCLPLVLQLQSSSCRTALSPGAFHLIL